jgi:hypothetical protein
MRREHHTAISDASPRLYVLDESNLSVFGIKLLSCGIEPPHDYDFRRSAVLLYSPMERFEEAALLLVSLVPYPGVSRALILLMIEQLQA